MDSFQTQRPGIGLHLPKGKDKAFIKATFELLDKVEKEIKLADNHKNIILVFSNSGNADSTITRWMFGKNAKLISTETKETDEYASGGGKRNADSNKGSLPDLIVDTKANITYYEFPGVMSAGRSISNRIVTTYFTKKVLDHAENIKIILSFSFSSLIKKNRQSFLQLVSYIIELVKDIEKFRNSIAMLVIEVNDEYENKGNVSLLVDYNKIKEDVVDFLLEAKKLCEEILKNPDISEKDRKYFSSTKTIIDVILEKNSECYPKIEFLRTKAEPKHIGNVTLIQEGERNLEKLLVRNLQYTRKDQGDFSYNASDKSKNEIADLVREINNNAWFYFNEVSHQILKNCNDLKERIHREIKLVTDDVFLDDLSLSTSKELSTEFNNAYNLMSNLMEEIKNSTDTEDIAMKVKHIVSSLNINISNQSVMQLVKQEKYLKFLVTLTGTELNRNPLEDVFKNTFTHLAYLRNTVQGEVREAAEKLNFRIVSSLNGIAEDFHKHYANKVKLSDIQQLPDELEKEYNVIMKMIEKIGNARTTNELVKTIHDCANMQDITVPKENMLGITNQGRYLEFLKNASKGELTIESTTWANPFEAISKYLRQAQKWYTFLNALYDKFSEYEIQKNKQLYNVANLEDWGKTDKQQGITITATSYHEFLSKIDTFNITEQESVRNITLTDVQLEELNHALNLTLKHTISAKCGDSVVEIRGSYIVSGESDSSENLDEDCLKSLFTKNTYVCAFVLNALYIDNNDFRLPFIIAPKWEISDQVTIDLSGSEGESRMTPFSFFEPRTRLKAANGTQPGARGADGKPGGPGGPGIIFFGIADNIVNGKNLTMKANGGDGGAGEHGGDGYSKNKALSAVSPSDSDRCQKNCKPVFGFKCQTLSYDFKPGQCSGSGKQKNCTSDEYSCKYKIFGRTGSGEKWKSDGGNGGRGGKGGQAGKVALFELSGDSGVVKVANRGKEGKNGLGGYPGCIDCNGDDIIVSFDSKVSSKWKLEETIKHGGKKGVDGGNTAGLLDPKPPYTMKDPAKIVNKYKSFLRENMVDRFTRIRHFQFLEKINSNDEINSLYDTMGFIDEFEELEKQFHDLNKKINFIPFYQSLLPRISEYSKSPGSDEKSSQHKKILNYLYTAILGRMSDLKDDSESYLIINISSYLDIVKREVEALKDLQKLNNKAEIINKYQERYKYNLDKKIEEAKNIIEKMITPEMETISKAMDSKIDLLIDETIELQRKVEKDKEALIKKKQELERAMALRGLFSCLSIFGQVLSFFGPVGAVVGTVIGATSSVAESLVLDNQQQDVQIAPDVVPNLKILGNQIKSVREKKVNYLSKLLEEITQEIGKNPKKLGDMSEKIADLKIRLNRVKENTYDFKEVKTLESELMQEIKNKEGQLKIEGVVPDAKTKGALKVVERMTQAVQLGSLLVDIYNKHKNDQEKVDTITDAIQKTDEKIKKLKEYEEQIYEVISPTLHSMENNLQDVASKLEAKSQASLEVTKWKVQSALRDMKLQMQQLTDGFQVKDSLARCIEKLEEVMTTLINVYDRIQNYQDQQNLANYIADVSSASASSINISNPNLVKAVNHLEMVIRSNVVLTQYKAAVNAFKQWVFPFANYYLEQSMLPSQLQLENNFENLVDGAVKQIDSIKSKLDLYKTSVKKTDKYINTGEFSSRYVSTEPFYVWKNEEYRDTISKLLSGQEVVLRADVKNSAPDKEAIKFSVVELYFKTNNETMQSGINNVIKGFDIMVTHLGNSYYRYADKIYVITSDSQTILYSCEKNTAGEPVRKNMVFDKIKEGDLMLSPYTLWEIKMINSTRKITFRDLDIYKDYIDIELSGYGSYILSNVNGFKPADKEYRSVGKFDEVDICIDSEARNSSDCTDVIGRMIRSAHHVQGYDGYTTNGAAPRLWSPINYACNFLKMHIAVNFVQFFIDEVKHLSININGDLAVKPSTDLKRIVKRSESSNAGGFKFVGNTLMKEDEISKHNCIDRGVSFNDCSRCFKKLFLLDATKERNNCFSLSDCLEVNSTLLLADVVARKITENKYKRAIEECLLSPKEKLQIRLENCAIRNDDDAKRHLHILSRMTDDSENSWLRGAKRCAKFIFQCLGLDKNPGPDEFVQDIGTLFA